MLCGEREKGRFPPMPGGVVLNFRKKIRNFCLVILALVLTGCAPAEPEPTPPQATLPSGDLTCLEISRFTGSFVEDGTDEAVTDVAAILVDNDTGRFLDLATVIYTVGNRTATFLVSGLPAGEQAWVLEKDRMTITEGDELVFKDCQTSFNDGAILTTDDLAVARQGNTVTVENRTDKTLTNVCIYYKNKLEDGTFLGGITYLMSFDSLEPGASAQNSARHFDDNSVIVRYGYQAG